MSSFVVEDQTINRIVSYLWRDRDNEHIKRQLTLATPAALGEELYRLNLAAVEDRYGDYAAGTMCDLAYRYRPAAATKIEVIKALSCWLYQCAEGDVPSHPLYQLMDQYRYELAMDIVRALPAYEAAPWA